MGKSLAASTRIHNLAKHLKSSKYAKPTSQFQLKKMESNSKSSSSSNTTNVNINAPRLPLSDVVSDCVKRWFKDTLKEAKNGDINMQVLVSQMYYSGYGVPRDILKGRIWMTRASRIRSSVWKVSDKRPGYNASDSDSDELNEDS